MFQYTRINALKQSMMQSAGPRRWSTALVHGAGVIHLNTHASRTVKVSAIFESDIIFPEDPRDRDKTCQLTIIIR